ncbi:MAG: hypothetical protein BWY11_01378 [Firmicutes bacterium ADurb.Bin182]|nr:MAG: hypothetical protein BWY11_01378 [Firmicutes bacterium ADurb.Bin182]
MKYTDDEIELIDINDIRVSDRTKPSLLRRMNAWIRGEGPDIQPGEPMLGSRLSRKQRQQIRDALQSWKDAVAYFENVDDPELIEYAVYEMEAAKRRYIFLLKNSHMI